jgi:hypothetical protein
LAGLPIGKREKGAQTMSKKVGKVKNALREKYSRPPFPRMQRIHEWIKGGKFPNAVSNMRSL